MGQLALSSKPGAACNTSSALNKRSLQSMTRRWARSKAVAPRFLQACRTVPLTRLLQHAAWLQVALGASP